MADATKAPEKKEPTKKTEKQKSPEVNTSLHIIKGAIVKVLHTPLTTSTDASRASEGRITIEYKLPTPPTKEQLDRIEKLANDKIKENVDILWFPMNRKEAEEKYSKNPVNETYIYDKFPVPPEITEVKIVEIADWNVNCSVGPLLKKTGEVRPLKILRFNHRPQKNELEIVFELSAETSKDKKSSNAETKKGFQFSFISETNIQASQAPISVSIADRDNVIVVSNKLIDEFFEELKLNGIEVSKEKLEAVRESLKPKVENKLSILKNTAYSKGMNARPATLQTTMKL